MKLSTKNGYVPKEVKHSLRLEKSRTIPDQSMTIEEIVKRFVRGIPIDIVQKDPVYIDQDEHDLEGLNRMSFSEKAEFAEQMKERAQGIATEQKARKERAQAKAKEAAQAKSDASQAARQQTGIDSLDNTMPVDTKLTKK